MGPGGLRGNDSDAPLGSWAGSFPVGASPVFDSFSLLARIPLPSKVLQPLR